MNEVLLTLEGVAVSRGGVTVLSGLSCSVAAGTALVLRGPNGVGKTTLLRAIAGLQPLVRGRIEGEAAAYSGHQDALKHTLTVRENLSFWASLHASHSVEPALEAFRLADLADRQAGQLSAGQKRRLGLARLLVSGRHLWLLDEPTVSLDKDAVDMFGRVMNEHLESGGAAMMATHIDLGVDAKELNLERYRASDEAADGEFDEAFL